MVSPVERAPVSGASTSAASRVIAVLGTFDARHRRQSLSSIARRAGLPLTTAHRLVHELARQSALVRGADGEYEVGDRVWRLGILASLHADLREVALPYMEDIYEVSGGAVHVAVLDGSRCLVVDRIAGSRTMAVISKPGSRLPLHASGVGKVLLAFAEPEVQQRVFRALDRYTSDTITNPDRLEKQLRSIVSRGFAQTEEELVDGASSIAVPLRGDAGVVVAALGVVLPSATAEMGKLTAMMQLKAAELSRKLSGVIGWRQDR